jgi:hypothetical protein
MTKLDDKARELGFTIKKGPTKFSGYILKRLNVSKQAAETKSNRARKATVDHLIDDDELQIDEYELQVDEYPIGSDYKWGLADIEDWLDAHAADIAAGRVKASDDDDAKPEIEIGVKRPKLKPASPAAMRKSLGGHEHAGEIKPLVGNAKAATPKPTVTLHDLNLEVRALKSRDEHKPNWHNPDGLHDRNEHDENDDRDLREYLKDVERRNKSFLAPEPDAPDFATPKATAAAQVVVVKRRVPKSDLPKRRTLLELAVAIRDAKDRKDQMEAGRLLNEAKALVDHGAWSEWLDQIGLSDRTARHWMSQNGKDDKKIV